MKFSIRTAFFALILFSVGEAQETPAPVTAPPPAATTTPPPPVAATTPVVVHVPVPAAPQLTEEQRDAIDEQKELVSRMPNPNDLIDYFQDNAMKRRYEKAFACIDFGKNPFSVKEKRNIVYMLFVVLNRLDDHNISDFPTDESSMLQDFSTPQGPIKMEFVRNENNAWQFSYKTIRDLEQNFRLLHNEPPIRHDWVMNKLPAWAFYRIAGMPCYRLLVVLGFLLLGVFLFYISEAIFSFFTQWLFKFLMGDYWSREKISWSTWKPVGLIALAVCWFSGIAFLNPMPTMLDLAYNILMLFCVVMGIWTLYRAIDLFALWLQHQLNHRDPSARDPNIDVIFIPMLTRTLKILFTLLGLATLAQTFNWPIVGVVSGMGIGGIAIAFAAKETIGNLFGSLTVLTDRPFVIGDWIVTDKIEGTVESVGMRSTRIRTFYNSLITIPNNYLTTAVIDNMGARRFRRYRTFLSVAFDTEPERIEAFCEGVRELIRRHPYTKKDSFYIFPNEFGKSSIDLLMVVYFVCPDSMVENRERGRLILDILRVAKELGVEFAYPTQTIHEYRETVPLKESIGVDPINSGRAAAIKVYPEED